MYAEAHAVATLVEDVVLAGPFLEALVHDVPEPTGADTGLHSSDRALLNPVDELGPLLHLVAQGPDVEDAAAAAVVALVRGQRLEDEAVAWIEGDPFVPGRNVVHRDPTARGGHQRRLAVVHLLEEALANEQADVLLGHSRLERSHERGVRVDRRSGRLLERFDLHAGLDAAELPDEVSRLDKLGVAQLVTEAIDVVKRSGDGRATERTCLDADPALAATELLDDVGDHDRGVPDVRGDMRIDDQTNVVDVGVALGNATEEIRDDDHRVAIGRDQDDRRLERAAVEQVVAVAREVANVLLVPEDQDVDLVLGE